MGLRDIDNLLKDIKDKFWENRIKRSVDAVLQIYNLSLGDVSISRQKIDPAELYVAAVEECNLEKAKEYFKKHPEVPSPITVIQHRHKKVLFMGSNRAVKFILHKKFPDCIVIKLPNRLLPKIISEAKLTLKEVIEKQK